ncbi:hypothetical protein BDL97_13G075500 [Sphagnum fallax]|nr:hypothetical protein BDL97_13G075500 [Sphagnum fallax]
MSGTPYGNPLVEDESEFLIDLAVDTPTSASQTFVSEDGIPNERARVLGGGSSLNAGFFSYASPDYVRSVGWNSTLVNESYAWVTPMVAALPELQTFQRAARAGLLEVGVVPDNGRTFQHLIGTKVGGSSFDSSGRRHTAADILRYANPDRITVLLWANTQRVLFTESDGQNPRATGVVYTDLNGTEHTVLLNAGGENGAAESEVILSAGAIGSPQLLMLSGIGPPEQLAPFNIPVILNQRAVGKTMADNAMNLMWIMTNKPVEYSLIQVVGITTAGSYIEVSSGEAQDILQLLSTMSSQNLAALVRTITRQSRTGLLQQFVNLIIDAVIRIPINYLYTAAQGGAFLQKIQGPYSHGELTLVTGNVSDNPSVRFNYYQRQEDLDACTAGTRTIMDVMNSRNFSKLLYNNETVPDSLRPLQTVLNRTYPLRFPNNYSADTASIHQWCRDTVRTIWHYHGGAVMGRVVDSDYRVMGVDALRVIDGSTFNFSPGTNPQATCMMLGR